MNEEVHVAAVQMDVKRDVKVNLATMRRAIETLAAAEPIDLVVFPELANSGYLRGRDTAFGREYLKLAEKIPGAFTNSLGEMAKKHHTYIVTGMLQAHPVVPASVYNSGVLIAPSGEVIGVHHKMHIPSEEKHYFYPGNTCEVYNTELGAIGVMVCADSSFPELARLLALKGADILCIVFNSARYPYEPVVPGSVYRTVTRAVENKVFAIGCNRVGDEDSTHFLGGTCIAAPSGQILAEAKQESEDIIRATLHAEALAKERAAFPVLAELRPELYAVIAQNY